MDSLDAGALALPAAAAPPPAELSDLAEVEADSRYVRQTSSCLTYLRHFVDVRAERAINGRAAYSGSRFASSKP